MKKIIIPGIIFPPGGRVEREAGRGSSGGDKLSVYQRYILFGTLQKDITNQTD